MECVILELHFANTNSLPIKFLGHISQKNLPGKCFRDQIIQTDTVVSKLKVKEEVITKSSERKDNTMKIL